MTNISVLHNPQVAERAGRICVWGHELLLWVVLLDLIEVEIVLTVVTVDSKEI